VALGPQHRRRFETFGFLVLPGYLADDIGWITAEFEASFAAFADVHDGNFNTTASAIVNHSAGLSSLVDHPRIVCLFECLLGADWRFWGSSGHLYAGDTGWHPDGTCRSFRKIKVSLYLDPVTSDGGALRVIPGSHRVDPVPSDGAGPGARQFGEDARHAADAERAWGISPRRVPNVALDSSPGDVVVFDQNLVHASWGGSRRRRLLTLNGHTPVTSDAAAAELRQAINQHARHWMPAMLNGTIVDAASSPRLERIGQMLAHQDELAGLSAAAAAAGRAPSPGARLVGRFPGSDQPIWQLPRTILVDDR
jgi:hypothetical protein